jgi:glucose-1-phosphate thymidylyltransferase
MKAIVLGAGFGTRLKPLTDNTAKPLIEVAGRPIVDYIIDKVLTIPAVDEILVVCNQRFFADYQDWSKKKECPIPLRLLNDGTTTNENRMGAIGDVLFAFEHMKAPDDVVIVGGDNMFTFDLTKLHDNFSKKGNTLALYDVGSLELAGLYGVVELNSDGKVTTMIEKPKHPKSSLVSVCLYMYKRSVAERLKEYRAAGNNLDLSGSFAAWLSTVEPVYGCSLDGQWFDIGDHESLAKAEKFFREHPQ